jgi:glycosyltransferase involved in cell wall biosynthesis
MASLIQQSDLTVVLPTRNEAGNIRSFLDSIPPAVSLVVVDASDDATPAIIEELRPHRTTILRRPGGISFARQLGSEAASSEWLIFTDADVEFPPGYFDTLCLKGDCDALYGPKLSQAEYSGYYHLIALGQRLCHWSGIPAATGSNMCIRRDALLAVGGFDTDLPCNEDSEVVWRLKRNGYNVKYAAELAVYARDHRRLHRGVIRKTAHSLTRCALLYTDLLPSRWRTSDWGYWNPVQHDSQHENP